MGLPFLRIDTKTTEFVLYDWDGNEHRFPGTVEGAAKLNHFAHDQKLNCCMSSDLNHPDEFPKFEKYAIDIAAGYYDEAVKAGVINITTPESAQIRELKKLKAEYEEASKYSYMTSEHYDKMKWKMEAIDEAIDKLLALEQE